MRLTKSVASTLIVLLFIGTIANALTVKDYHENLSNQAKGAFIAGYIDGLREALQSNKDRHGNLKTIETISENLELLDFVDRLFPNNLEELTNAQSGINELLLVFEQLRHSDQRHQAAESIIDNFIHRKFWHWKSGQ